MVFKFLILTIAYAQYYLPQPNKWTQALECLENDYFYMMTDKMHICLTCQRGCQECCDQNLCLSCLTGYRYNATTSACFRCPIYCDVCELQADVTKCKECQKGYFKTGLDDPQCAACLEGCATCQIATVCKICDDGFYLKQDGKCYECRYGCKTCSSQDGLNFACDSCIDEYYQVAKNCLHCPNGCMKCTDSSSCQSCWGNFQLLGSLCKRCVDNCQLCDEKSGQCYQCYPGFVYDQKSKACTGCPDIKCKICKLDDLSYCTQCGTGYDEYKGVCLECELNCLDCEKDSNFCVKCESTMFADEKGVCNSCGKNCKSCLSPEVCTECSDGYFVNNKECSKCSQDCMLCKSGQDCKQCAAGFFFNGYQCTGCDPACENCRGLRQCVKCTFGYFVQNGKCEKCIDDICTCKAFKGLLSNGYLNGQLVMAMINVYLIW